jgi:NTE family protein
MMRGNVSIAMRKLTIGLFYAVVFACSLRVAAPAAEARPQGPHKIALVLSGGGARGAAHIGVLKVLEREHIQVDCIAGTSFGALAGGLYAIGYSSFEIERILSGQDWNGILSDTPERRLTPLIQRRNSRYQAQVSFRGWTPELPTGFRGGQRLTESLDILTTSQMLRAGYDFDRLPIQFRAVATNLVDGKAYVFRQGSLTEALRASMAIPLLFTPVEKDDMLLADGGLVDNLPTDIARDLGADIIIAVDTTSPLLGKNEIRNFIDVVDQSISLQMVKNVGENRKLADIVLQPRLDSFTYNDFDKISEIVTRGEEEANRVVAQLKALIGGMPPRPNPAPERIPVSYIESISFRGLSKIRAEQLKADVRLRPGDFVDPIKIGADVNRLYATRFFDSVGYTLEPLPQNRYQLIFVVKESSFKSLGVGLRLDNDYNFLALVEFTALQLFHSPSSAILSSQFGGLENHYAALRLVPPRHSFVFVEPRGEVLRIERLDIRDKKLVDRFTDKREGGRLLIGGSLWKQLEISGGYRAERVRIEGGTEPNRLAASTTVAGLTFRLNRDTLDTRDFPHTGIILRFQGDKNAKSLGGELDYSKWEADYQRYFTFSSKSTFQINSTVGYSRGPVPFYDRFFIGGYSFSQLASRQFVGLRRDEFTPNQVALIGGSYRRELFSHSFSIVRKGYLTGIYNAMFHSSRETSPYNFDLLQGGAIGVALETLLGPIRATGGWAEGGRWNFSISFGPSF